jgi:hypothetical protein
MDFFKEASKLADTAKNAVEETASLVNEGLDTARTSAGVVINSTLSTVDTIKSFNTIDQAMKIVKTAAVDASAAGLVIVNSLQDIPKTHIPHFNLKYKEITVKIKAKSQDN